MKTELKQFTLSTPHEEFIDITNQIEGFIMELGVVSGTALVFCPHTTAAITINENADPDVQHDMLLGLNTVYPQDQRFRHMEGNSPAHLKCSTVGASEQLIIHNGHLVLGTWQSVYFCEFDGPRSRKFFVQISY